MSEISKISGYNLKEQNMLFAKFCKSNSAFLLIIPLIIYAFAELFLRIHYELQAPYTWDTTLYWAIGRGMANGIAPWSGLFETKPLGIFLLSEISYIITDDSYLTNIAQVIALVAIAASPAVALLLLRAQNPQSASLLKFSVSFLFGLLLALYAAERSGEVQVESFGAAFGCIAVIAMALYPPIKNRNIF